MSKFLLNLFSAFKNTKVRTAVLTVFTLIPLWALLLVVGIVPAYGQFDKGVRRSLKKISLSFVPKTSTINLGCGTNVTITPGTVTWVQTGETAWRADISDGSYTATYQQSNGPTFTYTSPIKYTGWATLMQPTADCSTWYYHATFTTNAGCDVPNVTDTHPYVGCVVPTPVPTATPTPTPVPTATPIPTATPTPVPTATPTPVPTATPTPTPTPIKDWTVDTGISATISPTEDPTVVANGGSLSVSVTASDFDHWTLGVELIPTH